MHFNFEHTYRLSEAEYVAIWSVLGRRRGSRLIRQLATVAAGVVLLFSTYTVVLGVLLLALAIVGTLMPRAMPGTAARTYRQLRCLADPVTYGVDQDSVWARASDFATKASWRLVSFWCEREGWLVLQGHGFLPVILPIERLQGEGLYETVMQRVREHAVEFDSAEAKGMSV